MIILFAHRADIHSRLPMHWVPFFSCMFRLNDRIFRLKNMLTSDERADRHNERFYAENKKLFEINETVLANLNDMVFYWKTVLFSLA